MKTERAFVRGTSLRFARLFFHAGRFLLIGAATLLAVSSASLSYAYPLGPELPDDGLYAADIPLPSLSGVGEWVEQFPGDLTGQLPSMNAADPASDPFDNSLDLAGGNPADSNWLVPYDGTYTNETYTGDPLATGAGSLHVGLDLGAVDSANWLGELPSGQYYADSSGTPIEQLPALGAQSSPPTSPGDPFHYLIVHLDASTSGGPTVGEWYELPYHPGVPQLTLTAGSEGVSLSGLSYFTTETQIPLDSLNVQDNPLPGSPGSPFTPLPQYDGSLIYGGGNKTLTLPEPGSLALGLMGGVVAVSARAYRRCRRAS